MGTFAEWFYQTYTAKGFDFDRAYKIQDLARESGKSHYQVRQGFPELISGGYIETKPGVGVFIIPNRGGPKAEPLTILAREITSAFSRNFLATLLSGCRERGFRPSIEMTFDDPEREVEILRRIPGATKAVVMVGHGPLTDWGAVREHTESRALVLVEPTQNPGLTGVRTDSGTGVALAVRHLVQRLRTFGTGRRSLFILADTSVPGHRDLATMALDQIRQLRPAFDGHFELRDRVRLVRLRPAGSPKDFEHSRFQVEQADSGGTEIPDVAKPDLSHELAGRHLVRQILLDLAVPMENPLLFEGFAGLVCIGDGLTRGVLETLRRLHPGFVPARFLVLGITFEPPVYGSFLSRLEPDYAGLVESCFERISKADVESPQIHSVPALLKWRRSTLSWEASLWHASASGTAVIKQRNPTEGRIELKFANSAFLLLNEKTLEDVLDKQPDEYRISGGQFVLDCDRQLFTRHSPLLTGHDLPPRAQTGQPRARFTLRWQIPASGKATEMVASLGFRFLAKDKFPIEVQHLLAQRHHFEHEPPDELVRAFFDFSPCTVAVHEVSQASRLLYMNLPFAYMLAQHRAARGVLNEECAELWAAQGEPTTNPNLVGLRQLRDKLLGTPFGEETEVVTVGDGHVHAREERPLSGTVFRGLRRLLRWPLYSVDAEPVAVASIGFDVEALRQVSSRFAIERDASLTSPAAVPITSLGLLEDATPVRG